MNFFNKFTLYLIPLLLITCCTSAEYLYNNYNRNSGFNVIKKLFEQCASKDELLKCFKIQALKIADRALHTKHLKIIDGVNLSISNTRTAKALQYGLNLNETKLEKLNSHEIDGLLSDATQRFLQTRKLDISVPRLIEEGRKKRRRQGYGALYWALAIKGAFLAMAYNGIAVMSGVALILGKLALLLSAILGLKKLASSGHHEKTTFEIIKQPKYSESHTHSTSFEDDGHYHRSFDNADQSLVHKQVYKAYIPTE